MDDDGRGAPALFRDVLAPGFVDEMPQGPRTRDYLVAEATAFHTANADVRLEIDQMVVEGEWVACRVTLGFTEGGGLEPLLRARRRRAVVEGTGYYDRLGVLEQTSRYASAERGTVV